MQPPPPGYSPAYTRPVPPPRKRRRWPLRLAIVLVVLAALVFAADRVSAAVAERITADSIQSSQHLAERPDVAIHGIPFLTQFASAQYEDVDITARDVPVTGSGQTLNVATFAVHLSGVSTTSSLDFDTIRADSATADARITYDDLGRTLGLADVSADGPGRVRTTVAASVGGQQVQASVSAAVAATSGDGLVFSDVRVSAGGVTVPLSALDLGSAFEVPIPLDTLPFAVQVTGLDVAADALVVHLAGQNLSYSP